MAKFGDDRSRLDSEKNAYSIVNAMGVFVILTGFVGSTFNRYNSATENHSASQCRKLRCRGSSFKKPVKLNVLNDA